MKRRGKFGVLGILCVMGLCLGACGGKKNEEAKVISCVAEPDDTVSFEKVEGYRDFSVSLLKNSMDEEKNTLVSPYSVLYAVGMALNGASGETLSEFETAIGMKREEINGFAESNLKKTEELSLANGIWFKEKESLKVEEEFLEKNRRRYEAEVRKAPFDEGTKQDINSWVKEKTKGRIPNLIDKIEEDAVMYLVNALSFDGKWKEVYEHGAVMKWAFANHKGEAKEVDMMMSEEEAYIEEKDAKGFLKPYEGGRYAFVALLPNEGVSIFDYVKKLEGKKLTEMFEKIESTTVEAGIPKFKSEYDVELKESFQKMGVKTAFESGLADFKKMAISDKNIFISRILHKTFVEVNEEGTKAGAATAVEMKEEAMALPPEETKEVILDRPFVYMILDRREDIPLFIGTVLEIE